MILAICSRNWRVHSCISWISFFFFLLSETVIWELKKRRIYPVLTAEFWLWGRFGRRVQNWGFQPDMRVTWGGAGRDSGGTLLHAGWCQHPHPCWRDCLVPKKPARHLVKYLSSQIWYPNCWFPQESLFFLCETAF